MTYFSQLPAANFFPASRVVADRKLGPNGRGVYCWSFNEKLGIAPDAKFEWGGRLISYIGIAPSRATSASSLRSRLRAHLQGNASSSTLRLTLGCLLAERLSLMLGPTGATGRPDLRARRGRTFKLAGGTCPHCLGGSSRAMACGAGTCDAGRDSAELRSQYAA